MISRESLARRKKLGERQVKRWDYPEECRTPQVIGKAGTTRKPCSCWMCCSPRRVYGNARIAKTMQEARLWPINVEREMDSEA